MTNQPRILIVNGSLGGAHGNSAALLTRLGSFLAAGATLEIWNLADEQIWNRDEMEARLERAEGFVFASGTYWDSWGSPLQRFFEETTDFETGDLWLGKPAAALITMNSVGGKEVLSRLQGVLSTLGVLIPPMSGMVYSLANHFALSNPLAREREFTADLWQMADLEVLAHNLLAVFAATPNWKSWPVDTGDPRRVWV